MQLFAQASVPSGLATFDYVVIAAYLLGMLGMGITIAFRQKSTDDFFLAGRSLPAWAVGISLMASLLSTITYLATPGEMFRTGPAYLLRVLAIPFILLTIWYIWIPFFMRLRLTSAYEYLEKRFNYTTRAMAAFFCLTLILGWMAVVVLTASKAMTEIVQLDLNWFFGKNIPATQTTEDGSAIFITEDLNNADSIAADWSNTNSDSATKVTQQIQRFLSAEEKAELKSNAEKQAVVLKVMNRLLTEPELYDAEAWQEVSLNDAAKTFVKVESSALTPQEITHFNRALFESLYPSAVAVSRPRYRDADMHALIIAVGLFSVLYTTLGGLRAVVWTDVIQFCVLVLGGFLTLATVAYTTNSGVFEWVELVQQKKYETVDLFSWDVGKRSTVVTIVIGAFFWTFCTHGSNQVALQRYFSVRDIREARKSSLINAGADVGLGILLGCVGMSLVYYVQNTSVLPSTPELSSAVDAVRNEAQDKVFPQFIRVVLPAGIRGLVVAALFAAAMSTIDSGANSISTIVTVDYYRPWKKENAKQSSELRLARTLTATMGVVIVLSTILLYHLSKGTDIISICQRGFNCFLGPLGALFFLGLFSKFVSSRAAILGVLVGELVGVGSSYSKDLFDVNFSTHLVIAAAFVATFLSAHLFGFILRDFATEEQQKWMYGYVLKQELPPLEEANSET